MKGVKISLSQVNKPTPGWINVVVNFLILSNIPVISFVGELGLSDTKEKRVLATVALISSLAKLFAMMIGVKEGGVSWDKK